MEPFPTFGRFRVGALVHAVTGIHDVRSTAGSREKPFTIARRRTCDPAGALRPAALRAAEDLSDTERAIARTPGGSLRSIAPGRRADL